MLNNESIFNSCPISAHFSITVHATYQPISRIWRVSVHYIAPDFNLWVVREFSDKEAFTAFVHRYNKIGKWVKCGYFGDSLHKSIDVTIHA